MDYESFKLVALEIYSYLPTSVDRYFENNNNHHNFYSRSNIVESEIYIFIVVNQV